MEACCQSIRLTIHKLESGDVETMIFRHCLAGDRDGGCRNDQGPDSWG